MSKDTLFERVGGTAGISELVEEFYSRVLGDPELEPFFKDTPMDKLQRMQVELFSAALGGPVVYSGGSMREVHAGLDIQKSHLQRFVGHLMDTLKGFHLDENDVTAIYSRIALHADEITGETTEDG